MSPDPLVELTRELSVAHIKLTHGVARRNSHEAQVFGVPGAHDDAPVLWVVPDEVHGVLQLIRKL
ncbi:hypothetical protein [Chinese giant salamander iridovirus]|uniref:Uncharacterized protein n=1 Tax=Chinese giant salamander iridovirus TaxID=1213990 RepID=V5MZT9_FRG3V|nr:hypothetical protein [Chinese giant salamander iridovirus]